MTLREIVKKNRSRREYIGNIRIPRDLLLEWIDNARLTPSTVNIQPLKYIIADSDADCSYIRSHVHFAGKLPDYSGPDEAHSPSAYIVIVTDKTLAPNIEPFDKDVGIAAQTILLSATEAGFGGCMIGAFDFKPICEYYRLGDNLVPRLIISLGKPDDESVRVETEDIDKDGDITYYRIGGVHHVPKRKLDDIIIHRSDL